MAIQSNKNNSRKLTLEELHVIDICQQIFKLAEEFYQYLAEIHHENSETARMWSLLAIDKCNHSDTYKFANRLKGEGLKEIHVDLETAVKILSKMKSIPKTDKLNPPPVVDALVFSIKMEEILDSVHFRQVVEFISEQDTSLMISSIRSSGSILHLLTEEYLSLTVMESDGFEDVQPEMGLRSA